MKIFPTRWPASINHKAELLGIKKNIALYRKKYFPIKPLPARTDRAYWAGLFDGEGSITGRIISRPGEGKWSEVGVSIFNTNKQVIDKLKKIFGGSICIRPARPGLTYFHRKGYQWQARTLIAERFLKAVYPFLIIKKTKARAALRFRAVVSVGGQRIAPNIRKKIKHLFTQI